MEIEHNNMMHGVPGIPDWMQREFARGDEVLKKFNELKVGVSNAFSDIPGMPDWMKSKAQQLDMIVTYIASISAVDIRVFPKANIMRLKRHLNTAQELRQELIDGGINAIANKNQAWSVLDTLCVQEVNAKLELIRLRGETDEGADVKPEGEVVDVSKPLPTDDFSDEEEQGSFW